MQPIKSPQREEIKDEITTNTLWFLKNRNSIIAHHNYEYVLIQNCRVLGYFETEEEAIAYMGASLKITYIVRRCYTEFEDIRFSFYRRGSSGTSYTYAVRRLYTSIEDTSYTLDIQKPVGGFTETYLSYTLVIRNSEGESTEIHLPEKWK